MSTTNSASRPDPERPSGFGFSPSAAQSETAAQQAQNQMLRIQCRSSPGRQQAGDGSRTHANSLEGCCATTTPRPQGSVAARVSPKGLQVLVPRPTGATLCVLAGAGPLVQHRRRRGAPEVQGLRKTLDGRGRIRTSVGNCQQIYSLPPLTTREPVRNQLAEPTEGFEPPT